MKTYTINFGGHVLAQIVITDDKPTVINCMDGYGSAMPIENILIQEEP